MLQLVSATPCKPKRNVTSAQYFTALYKTLDQI